MANLWIGSRHIEILISEQPKHGAEFTLLALHRRSPEAHSTGPTYESVVRRSHVRLLVRHRRRRVSAEAIAPIHPPLQVAIAYHQHPDQHELQDLYYQPD